MADDLSQAMEQLQKMLNSEDGAQKLNEMVSAIGGMFGKDAPQDANADSKKSTPHHENAEDNSINLDFLIKAKGLFDKVKDQKDDKTALLNALRPYMRPERAQKLDMIIKLVSLTKLGSVMGDMKGLF